MNTLSGLNWVGVMIVVETHVYVNAGCFDDVGAITYGHLIINM